MAELPPLSEASHLCESTAQVMNQTAYLDYREPTVDDIDAFDRDRGSGVMPDPLLTAHRLSRFYLVSAGDFVYSIGKLLALSEPMVVSPAVLARSAAEYASRCKYIADSTDSPEVRLSKLANLFQEGFADLGASKSDADHGLVSLAARFNDWRSTQHLPRAPKPNYSALVAALSPDMGKGEYEQLSGVAHANAITLSGVFIAAQLGHAKRLEDSWRHALFATQCGLLASAHVCLLRDGDKEPINECLGRFYHYVNAYNRYLWDRSVEQGFTPRSLGREARCRSSRPCHGRERVLTPTRSGPVTGPPASIGVPPVGLEPTLGGF